MVSQSLKVRLKSVKYKFALEEEATCEKYFRCATFSLHLMQAVLFRSKLSPTLRLALSMTFFVLLAPLLAVGQHYTLAGLRAKADSVLRRRLGAEAFAHVRYDSLSYYEFTNAVGHKKYATFSAHHTKGRFRKGEIRYNVLLPYPKCPAFSVIRGRTGVAFDSHQRVVQEPYLAFIPASYWTGQVCQLLSASQALAIARQLPLKPGIKPLTADLAYEVETKTFTWSIINYLTELRDYENKPEGSLEEVLIDASTGTVKAQRVSWYGVVR